jgi:DNA-binding NarL/FixJ family response regulator
MEQFNELSNREWEVAKLLLEGKSNKLIALSLGISDRTVEFHLKNIYTQASSKHQSGVDLKTRAIPSCGQGGSR